MCELVCLANGLTPRVAVEYLPAKLSLEKNLKLKRHAGVLSFFFNRTPATGGKVDLKDIKAIIDLMKRNDLAEFQMEKEGFKIRIKRGAEGFSPSVVRAVETIPAPAMLPAVASPPAAGGVFSPAQTPSAAPANVKEIVSPMVGTFYRAPSPDAANFVEVGQQVDEETVVCIIEAMKVMNEIKAEVKGVIAEVVSENGKPVEFGQALFKVKAG
jgi:acetyl-CoA carboxylase biotin carboxyl carrier protein